MFAFVFTHADAAIGEAQHRHALILAEDNADSAGIACELERIGEYVDYDFVQAAPVRPQHKTVDPVMPESEVNAAFLRLSIENGGGLSHERDKVCRPEMQVHLAFVNLLGIHHLIHQPDYPLGVLHDGAVCDLSRRIAIRSQKFLHRTDYKRHRITYFM